MQLTLNASIGQYCWHAASGSVTAKQQCPTAQLPMATAILDSMALIAALQMIVYFQIHVPKRSVWNITQTPNSNPTVPLLEWQIYIFCNSSKYYVRCPLDLAVSTLWSFTLNEVKLHSLQYNAHTGSNIQLSSVVLFKDVFLPDTNSRATHPPVSYWNQYWPRSKSMWHFEQTRPSLLPRYWSFVLILQHVLQNTCNKSWK